MQRLLDLLLGLANLALEAPWPRPRRLAATTVLLVALLTPTSYMAWIQARYRPQFEAITSSIVESISDAASAPTPTSRPAPGRPDP